MIQNKTKNLVKEPREKEAILMLLSVELRLQKFFSILSDVGFSEPDFKPNIDEAIRKLMGIDDGKDETNMAIVEIYFKYYKKIDWEDDKLHLKLAMKAYQELLKVRKKVKTGKMRRIVA